MNPTQASLNPHLFPRHIARPATQEDIIALAETMRPECIREVQAATGLSPLESLTTELPLTYVVEGRDGLLIASLSVGHDPDSPRHCALSILTSENLSKQGNTRIMVEGVSEAILTLHRAGYDSLHAFVHHRNIVTAGLLSGAGFSFIQRYDHFGKEGEAFCYYQSKIKTSCATQLH